MQPCNIEQYVATEVIKYLNHQKQQISKMEKALQRDHLKCDFCADYVHKEDRFTTYDVCDHCNKTVCLYCMDPTGHKNYYNGHYTEWFCKR